LFREKRERKKREKRERMYLPVYLNQGVFCPPDGIIIPYRLEKVLNNW